MRLEEGRRKAFVRYARKVRARNARFFLRFDALSLLLSNTRPD